MGSTEVLDVRMSKRAEKQSKFWNTVLEVKMKMKPEEENTEVLVVKMKRDL